MSEACLAKPRGFDYSCHLPRGHTTDHEAVTLTGYKCWKDEDSQPALSCRHPEMCSQCFTAIHQHDSLLAEVERLRGELDDAQRLAGVLQREEKRQKERAITAEKSAHSRYGALDTSVDLLREYKQRIASLEADNARLASEQQHCAKCGGVECHALAGLFCGEHSFSGCGEWGGCPICENANLKSALAASGRGE